MNTPLKVGDEIALVLPDFTLAGSPSAPVVMDGCNDGDATTFSATVGVSNSGQATATMTLTAASNTMDAHTRCTVAIDTGVTTSATAQSADDTSRKVGVTLAQATDIAATTAIAVSTAVVVPASPLFAKSVFAPPS